MKSWLKKRMPLLGRQILKAELKKMFMGEVLLNVRELKKSGVTDLQILNAIRIEMQKRGKQVLNRLL